MPLYGERYTGLPNMRGFIQQEIPPEQLTVR